jgi:hypothetical protein
MGLAIVTGSLVLLEQQAGAQAPGVTVSGLAPIGSILEIMQEIVDPMADAIWESVSVVITKEGSKETRPRTDAEWLAIRNNALMLAESGQLLKMPRPVGPAKPIPGVSFDMPGPDDLSPAQVETLLKRDRRAFDAFAQKLTDGAMVALRAVDSKSVDGLYEAGDAIFQACEACHMSYWYPAPDSPVRKTLK